MQQATTESTEGQSGALNDPDTYTEEPIKTIRSLAAESPGDEIQYTAYGASRYDSYPVAGSYLVRAKVPFEFSGTSPTFSGDIRDILHQLTEGFLDLYEAYAVEDLQINVQAPANFLRVRGAFRVGYVEDPFRTEVPYAQLVEQNAALRYCDARNIRAGDHFQFRIPCPNTKYFTGPESNRFTSPGRFFMQRLHPVEQGESPPYETSRMITTVTARVSGYCPTIRSTTDNTRKFADMGSVAGGEFGVEIDILRQNNAILVLDLDTTTIDPDQFTDGDVAYLINPLLLEMKVQKSADSEPPTFDHKAFDFSIPVSKLEIIKDDSPIPVRIVIDVSRVLQIVNAPDGGSLWAGFDIGDIPLGRAIIVTNV